MLLHLTQDARSLIAYENLLWQKQSHSFHCLQHKSRQYDAFSSDSTYHIMKRSCWYVSMFQLKFSKNLQTTVNTGCEELTRKNQTLFATIRGRRILALVFRNIKQTSPTKYGGIFYASTNLCRNFHSNHCCLSLCLCIRTFYGQEFYKHH